MNLNHARKIKVLMNADLSELNFKFVIKDIVNLLARNQFFFSSLISLEYIYKTGPYFAL